MSQVCLLALMCKNGEAMFRLKAGEPFECDFSEEGFLELERLLLQGPARFEPLTLGEAIEGRHASNFSCASRKDNRRCDGNQIWCDFRSAVAPPPPPPPPPPPTQWPPHAHEAEVAPVGDAEQFSASFFPAPRFAGVPTRIEVIEALPSRKAAWCTSYRGGANCGLEWDEWMMVDGLIDSTHTVLELGGRYGTTSCRLARATGNSGRCVD